MKVLSLLTVCAGFFVSGYVFGGGERSWLAGVFLASACVILIVLHVVAVTAGRAP